METLSKIQTFPIKKDEIQLFIDNSVELILSGKYNPLEIEVKLKAMEEIIKALRGNQDVKDFAMDEAEKHGKSFDFAGAKFSIVETGRYDYSADPEWKRVDNEIKLLKEHQKIQEKLLRDLDKEVADPDTGEIIIPAKKVTTKQIRVSLK
jgi:hypothetical protein